MKSKISVAGYTFGILILTFFVISQMYVLSTIIYELHEQEKFAYAVAGSFFLLLEGAVLTAFISITIKTIQNGLKIRIVRKGQR